MTVTVPWGRYLVLVVVVEGALDLLLDQSQGLVAVLVAEGPGDGLDFGLELQSHQVASDLPGPVPGVPGRTVDGLPGLDTALLEAALGLAAGDAVAVAGAVDVGAHLEERLHLLGRDFVEARDLSRDPLVDQAVRVGEVDGEVVGDRGADHDVRPHDLDALGHHDLHFHGAVLLLETEIRVIAHQVALLGHEREQAHRDDVGLDGVEHCADEQRESDGEDVAHHDDGSLRRWGLNVQSARVGFSDCEE